MQSTTWPFLHSVLPADAVFTQCTFCYKIYQFLGKEAGPLVLQFLVRVQVQFQVQVLWVHILEEKEGIRERQGA